MPFDMDISKGEDGSLDVSLSPKGDNKSDSITMEFYPRRDNIPVLMEFEAHEEGGELFLVTLAFAIQLSLFLREDASSVFVSDTKWVPEMGTMAGLNTPTAVAAALPKIWNEEGINYYTVTGDKVTLTQQQAHSVSDINVKAQWRF